MKDDINGRLTGLASSVLREKMVNLILSDKFPSVEHCNIYVPEKKVGLGSLMSASFKVFELYN